MKIQCDVRESSGGCDLLCRRSSTLREMRCRSSWANKLASKHQRLLLQCLSTSYLDVTYAKLLVSLCFETLMFIKFYGLRPIEEDIEQIVKLPRPPQKTKPGEGKVALLGHWNPVALSSSCNKDNETSCPEPPNQNSQQISTKIPVQQPSSFTSSWAVDDLLHLSDFDSPEKTRSLRDQITEEALAPAEVPQLPMSQSSNIASYKPSKYNAPYKKPRIEVSIDNDDEYFTVPDLG
ncbi:hypothetical protein FNV43_RR00760 [Rhamnella rubrinervis]|uniref:Uncharacterized protein n=1 Tax=Rhamnella rubrinervis TaxID=2594499 RepID=A0A8K0MRP5_9ROSA|nr:hypothetical protein FNV43_RR00760 [Rhamnella rubrinervis]